MRVSLQGRAIKNSKCAFRYSRVRKIVWNLRFATVSHGGHTESCKSAIKTFRNLMSDVRGSSRHTKIIVLRQSWTSDQHEVTKGSPVDGKNWRFTTVLNVRRAQSDERVRGHIFLGVRRARSDEKVALATCKICIYSPQFWVSDEHEVTRGLFRNVCKMCISPQFCKNPMSTKCREGQTYPASA